MNDKRNLILFFLEKLFALTHPSLIRARRDTAFDKLRRPGEKIASSKNGKGYRQACEDFIKILLF